MGEKSVKSPETAKKWVKVVFFLTMGAVSEP